MKVKTGRYVVEVMTERMAELEEEIAGIEKQLKEKMCIRDSCNPVSYFTQLFGLKA